MDRLLVTGIDSLIGANLAAAVSDRVEVHGCYAHRPVAINGIKTHRGDVADAHFAALARQIQPDWILHCPPTAASSWDWPTVRASGPRDDRAAAALSELSSHIGCRLAVVTTDAVFAGPRMFHDETSPPNAPRAAAARAVEKSLESTGALVVRSHVYGWCPVPENAGWAESLYHALAAGSASPLDGHRYATPILASDLAELLWRAFELRLQGLYHISGAERTNSFRFAQEMALACGLPAPIWTTDARETAAGHEAHEEETSLTSRRARRALEATTPLLREGLARFAAQTHNGWRERWRVGHPAADVYDHAA